MDNANKPTVELIKRLSAAIGVSGYAGDRSIHHALTRELTPLVDRVERDRVDDEHFRVPKNTANK